MNMSRKPGKKWKEIQQNALGKMDSERKIEEKKTLGTVQNEFCVCFHEKKEREIFVYSINRNKYLFSKYNTSFLVYNIK